MRDLMVTLTGPSCSGKTELLSKLLSTGEFQVLRSLTTRARREGEGDSEYLFVMEPHFKHALKQGELAQSTVFSNVSYGTTWKEIERVLETGKIPIRIVEPTGVDQFTQALKHRKMDVFSVFVDADFDVIIDRWIHRINESDNPDIAHFTKRLITSSTEERRWFMVRKYDLHVISNDSAEGYQAFSQVRRAVERRKKYGKGLRAIFNRLRG